MQARSTLWPRLALLLTLGITSAAATQGGARQQQQRQQQQRKPESSTVVIQDRDASTTDEGQVVRQLDPDEQRRLEDLERQIRNEAWNQIRFGHYDAFDRAMNNIAPVFVFLVFMVGGFWVLRLILENRRWNKIMRIQTDIHTKLLEKFANSQEMLAYMQSDAGKRFLEAAPLEVQPQSAAPYSRILFSAQVGLVVGLLGTGFLMLRGHIQGDGSGNGNDLLLILGTIGLTLGIGFLLSAAASYVLSKRFGLLDRGKTASTSVAGGSLIG